MGFGILKGSLYPSFCYMREIEVWGGGKIIHYKSTDPWRKEGELGCKNPCLTPSLLFSGSSWKKKKMFDRSDFPTSGRKKYTGKKEISLFFFGGKNVCSKCCPPRNTWPFTTKQWFPFSSIISPLLKGYLFALSVREKEASAIISPPPPRVWQRRRCVRPIRGQHFCLSRCVCHSSQEEGEEKIEDMPPPPQSWELILTWVMTWAACLREISSSSQPMLFSLQWNPDFFNNSCSTHGSFPTHSRRVEWHILPARICQSKGFLK